jgi:prepilin-type N-terminal cleavage/methylation domain-containing protein/prepilin-type processing-associated H-X9-DG protein
MQQTNPLRLKCCKAFSIIELLVVITIVSVLLAVLLPSMTNARELAYRAKCAAGARQLDVTCQAYAADNRNYYPTSYTTPFPSVSVGVIEQYHVQLVRLAYADRNRFTSKGGCPYGPANYSTSHWNPQTPITNVNSYGLNGRILVGPGDYINTANNGVGIGFYGPMRMDRQRAGRHPSLLGTVLDSTNPGTNPNDARYQISEQRFRLGLAAGTASGSFAPAVIADTRNWRHKGDGLNMAFLDGHVQFVPRQDYIDYQANAAHTPLFMRVTFNNIYSTWNGNFVDGLGQESWWRR